MVCAVDGTLYYHEGIYQISSEYNLQNSSYLLL